MISSFINGSYNDNNQRVCELCEPSWLTDYQQKKTLPAPPQFVETATVVKEIWAVFQFVLLAQCMNMIVGVPGVKPLLPASTANMPIPGWVTLSSGPRQASPSVCWS